jgi:hypothetical protein
MLAATGPLSEESVAANFLAHRSLAKIGQPE